MYRILIGCCLTVSVWVAGCTVPVVPVAPETAATGAPASGQPAPEQIRLVGDEITTLTADRELYGTLIEAWNELLAGISGRARTFYPPQRFEEEIAPLARVEVQYAEPIQLLPTDPAATSDRLVFAHTGSEYVLLGLEDESWTAFVLDEAAAQAFADTVSSVTDLVLGD